MTLWDFIAFGAMVVVFVGVIVAVILLGDLPAKIARRRQHPQVAAVQALSWLGLLFTGGALWILAMVWAYYQYPSATGATVTAGAQAQLEQLCRRVEQLEATLARQGTAS